MKIRGLGRIKKAVSCLIGRYSKFNFESFIQNENFDKTINLLLINKKQIKIELVTFTNSKNFPDFLLSILSFVSSNGIPTKWTIYADDEFTLIQKKILAQFDFIVFKHWYDKISNNTKLLYESNWQYRKYLSFSAHDFSSTTIFLDSDVLFYKDFKLYTEIFNQGNWYLADPVEAFSVDLAILKESNYKQNMYIINSGFMVFNNMPSWNLGMGYLEKCLKDNFISHFTEQTAINIVYANDANAKILEPRRFHVSAVDHFKISFLKTDNLAIRHYVGLIRHKMWQSGWEKFIQK